VRTQNVPSSWLNRDDRRFDAGPYTSGALEAKIRLDELGIRKNRLRDVTRGGMAGLVNPGRIKRLWVTDPSHGKPFLSSTDILQADLSTIRYISNRAVEENPSLLIKKGSTLITRSGTIGRMCYVRPDMDSMACTEHVLRVIPDETDIPSGYLFAFLSGRFGVPLVTSGTYGAIIQHIEPQHIADLPVPRLSNEIELRSHELIESGARKLASYQSLISAATERIFKAANIWNPTLSEWYADKSDVGFTVNSSELQIMRAWNHSRRAARIKEQIRSGSWSRLGDVTDSSWMRWRTQFQRIDADPEYGLEVITQKPLFRLFPEGRWVSKKYLMNLSPRYLIPDRTILVAKQGTFGEDELFGRCEYVTGPRMLARAYSDHCMRLVAKDGEIHPGYLFAFLRSEAGFRLFRSLAEGAKQQDLHWRTVPELPIPRCEFNEEQEIGAMIDQAYSYRNDAVDKMLEAAAMVELAIDRAR
jgi:type I restriction enzyme S subunit